MGWWDALNPPDNPPDAIQSAFKAARRLVAWSRVAVVGKPNNWVRMLYACKEALTFFSVGLVAPNDIKLSRNS